MFDIFKYSGEKERQCHTKLSDIAPEAINEWRSVGQQSGVDPDAECLKSSEPQQTSSKLNNEIEHLHRELHIATQYITRETLSHVSIPIIFVLTDRHGTILKVVGKNEMIERLRKVNFQEGTSLALEDAGINGISVAMQMKKTVVVRGDEHDLNLLSHFTCICAPIKHDNEIVAYLDLSLSTEEGVTFAVPILKQIVYKIEEYLAKDIAEDKKSHLLSIFTNYNLSPREKEIAFLLLNNASREQIAKRLFITVDTVHSHVRNVYNKTNATDKSEFIRRFVFLLK